MRQLALLLHFYQPPTQSNSITEQVLRSCYLPLADLLLAHPEASFTLNISGSLLEDINATGDHSFIEKIKILLGRKQVELSNSPVYHPLLPLINAGEIATHLEINKKVLSDTFQTEPVNIIYPPELAIKPEMPGFLGDATIMIDESSVNPEFDINKIPEKQVFKNFAVISRSVTEILRLYPAQLTADKFMGFLEARTNPDQTIICASDAEVFGHHYTERINLLRELLEGKKMTFVKISNVIPSKSEGSHKIEIHASSWQTTAEDLKNDNPFPMWLNPQNNLQVAYNNLAEVARQKLLRSPDPNPQAQVHYLRGISSCHYYWLSNWPWWHPDLVEAGARELVRSVRSLYIEKEEKLPVEKMYHDFLMAMWSYHWSGEVQKKYAEYNQFRQKLLESLPVL